MEKWKCIDSYVVGIVLQIMFDKVNIESICIFNVLQLNCIAGSISLAKLHLIKVYKERLNLSRFVWYMRWSHYREVYNIVCVNKDTHEADLNKLDLI